MNLRVIGLLVALTPTAGHAVAIDPFVDAKTRELLLKQAEQADTKKITELVNKAFQNLSQESTNANPKKQPFTDKDFELKSKKTIQLHEPDSFAVIGIRGQTVLIRQHGQHSMILKSKDSFWEKGQRFVVEVVNKHTVKVTRHSDKQVVFIGAPGAVFNPSASNGSAGRGVKAY